MTRLMPARSSSDLREIIGTTVIAPPDQAYVTLSEAVSWAAFGASMDASKLARCLGMERKPTKSRRRYQRDIVLDRAIEIGIERLIDLARRNELKLQGRFFPSILSDDREILVQPIGAVGLANYQRFEVSGDILYRGRGVAWQTLRRDLPPVSDDHYRDVTVERGDLLKVFPSPAQAPNMTCYTVKAEQACERWLNNAFRNDPFKKRAKRRFARKHCRGLRQASLYVVSTEHGPKSLPTQGGISLAPNQDSVSIRQYRLPTIARPETALERV